MEIRRKWIFDTLEQLYKNRFYLFGCDIYIKFPLEDIPNNLVIQLKVQNSTLSVWRDDKNE